MDVHHQETDEVTVWLLGYAALGVFGGFVAGLFGVGGGLAIVPLLVMLFAAQGFSVEHTLHLALGTAMAGIMFTSVSSMRAHHAHGAVRWDIVKVFAPGLVAGTFGGSLLVGLIPTRPLAVIFTAIVCYAAASMLLDRKPRPHRQLPGPLGLFLVAGGIGLVSSLVAAGGGFLSIPFMVFCNVRIHQAVGTSAALGFPIALAGAAGYVASGLAATGLPPGSVGYIYVPALLGVVLMSVLVAPYGARLAHRLPVRRLKGAFGIFLTLMAVHMLYGLLA